MGTLMVSAFLNAGVHLFYIKQKHTVIIYISFLCVAKKHFPHPNFKHCWEKFRNILQSSFLYSSTNKETVCVRGAPASRNTPFGSSV